MTPWLLAARPKTLVAGLVPVLVGTSAAHHFGNASVLVFWSALLGALLIQVGTNYVNDASDFERGADSVARVGPRRMAQLGLISPKQLYIGAGVCFLLAAIAGVFLVHAAGWAIAVIGIVSIVAAIAYTAGPFPLAYLGLGDLFVLFFFGFVAVGGTYFAHGNPITYEVGVLGAVVGLHATALIAVNNIRDIGTDSLVGKKTLAVRMGERSTKYYICILLFAPYLALFGLAGHGGASIYWVFASMPVALVACWKVIKASEPAQYMAALPLIALVQLLYGVLLAGTLFFGVG